MFRKSNSERRKRPVNLLNKHTVCWNLGVGTSEHLGRAEQQSRWGERGKPEAEEWKPSAWTIHWKPNDSIKGDQISIRSSFSQKRTCACIALSSHSSCQLLYYCSLARFSKGQRNVLPNDICLSFYKTGLLSYIIWPINLTLYFSFIYYLTRNSLSWITEEQRYCLGWIQK